MVSNVASISIRFTGAALRYTNKDKSFAFVSGLLSGLIEIGGRFYTVHVAIPKKLEMYRLELAYPDKTKAERLEMLLKNVNVKLSDENELKVAKEKARLIQLFATNVQSDFVGEKTSILLGGLINYLIISEGETRADVFWSSVVMTAMFLALEFATEMITAYILVVHYDVPLRKVLPFDLKGMVITSVAVAFVTNSLVSCFWMIYETMPGR